VVLITLLAAGCFASPVPQVNAIVEVFNQTSNAGTLEWQGSSTGNEPIAPCSADTTIGLGPGTWRVTITEGSNRQALALTAPATGGFYEVLEISPDGQIADLYTGADQRSLPPRPAGWAFCTGP
jgi:hypothetical protein